MIYDFIQIFLLALLIIILSVNGVKIPQFRNIKTTIVDSCGLIDGRILDLLKAGFLAGKIIIPKFVLDELQLLADGNDSQKRERARFGLDVAREILQHNIADSKLDNTDFASIKTTDDKLLALAKKIKGQLYTTDFNLNKRAGAEGIDVLNINELAQLMRPLALPGEAKEVKIVERGSNRDQGVGYLEDGTMVVVENAAKLKGKKVQIKIIRSLQTVAGKMIFAEVKHSTRRHSHSK